MEGFADRAISSVKGIGPTRAKQLEKLGVKTVKDLVYLFPRAYENRGNVKLLSEATLDTATSLVLTVGTVPRGAKIRNGFSIYKFRAFDDSGAVEVVFFNSPFVKDVFQIGSSFRFWGKLSYSKRQLQLISPKYEPIVEGKPLSDLVPVYPLTEGISSKIIDKLMLSIIDEAASSIIDPLPEEYRLKYSLPTLGYALRCAHFPKNEKELTSAMRRLAFDEMLLFGLGIALSTHYKTKSRGIPFSPCSLKPLTDLLPYELTSSQKNAVNDIYRDTVIKNADGTVSSMARIIVGDVGCGKTVCAAMAIYIAAKSAYQSALMVPTEILARQHYAELSSLLGKLGIRVELLLGQTTQKEKKRIYSELQDGKIDVLVGTHALITDKVIFKNLALVITDEQHRFGVAQRSLLKEKAEAAHLLVMSATPIPRTLALTMYGDLDISRITEMPKGRMRVDTFVVDESYRQRLNEFIRKQISLGGQCYIVCPAIENKAEDDDGIAPQSLSTPFATQPSQLKNAVEYTEELRKELPELSIEYLHGKMKGTEKDGIMKRFSDGEINILVSTTVIEVGINVPNATLMIVENAERFGLSQLHQLRGRVGRGTKKSYCVLVSDLKTEKATARLDIMRTTYDGYEIADKDLAMRGPGDFFSNNSTNNMRQSGGFEFKFASLCDDENLFVSAFSLAKDIVNRDATLTLDEHIGLKLALADCIRDNSSTIS